MTDDTKPILAEREQGAVDALRYMAKLFHRIADHAAEVVGPCNPNGPNAQVILTKRSDAEFLNMIAQHLEKGRSLDSLVRVVDGFKPKDGLNAAAARA